MEKFIWILSLVIIGYFLRKKIFKVITFIFIPKKCKIKGEFIKSWKAPFFVPMTGSSVQYSDSSPGYIYRYFLSLKSEDCNKVDVEISLFLLNEIKRHLGENKKCISLMCEKYEWERNPSVINVVND
jgi:hypothetical protein